MFIRPEEIYMDIARTYKSRSFSLYDVIEWCMQVETDHICDVDIMIRYEATMRVSKGRIDLPNNIYRILLIEDEYGKLIERKAITGSYIHGLGKYEGQRIRIEFLGVPLDYDCMPLVAASHRDACRRYVIIQLFEDEAASDFSLYKIQANRWTEFAGIVLKAKQGFREWTIDAIASLSLHRYNEPFKDLYYKLAERHGDVFTSMMKVGGREFSTINEELDIMDIKTMMNSYVEIINNKIDSMPFTKSITYVLGKSGMFSEGIWTLPLDASLGINTFENTAITLYANGNLILAPVICNPTFITVDLSKINYDSNTTYTLVVVPPTNVK